MEQTVLDTNQIILDLNKKMDSLATQVAYLTEQAQISERGRQDRSELVETMMPIARDVMEKASAEMGEVQEFIEMDDLIRLVKKLARHRPQIEMLVDQIDAVTDMLDIVGPITREAMDKATTILGDLERKGYFKFPNSGMRMFDNIVTSFTEEDLDRLGDNIVLILNTVKDMTQPEIMNFIHDTFLVAEKEIEKPVDISYLGLVRQMQDPAVRRGLALTMRVMHVIGSQPAN